jgi:tetratricopeptide (TPR) repeat protein
LAGSAFKDADVIKILSGFTPILVDGDTEKDITKKYGAHGYPTLIVADAAGEEIDRIVGYLPTAAFAKEIARIKSGEGTLAGLRRKVAESPDDLDAAIALGAKLAGGNADEAAKVFGALIEKTKDKDKATQGRIHLEYAAALFESGKAPEAMTEAELMVKDFAGTPSAGATAARVGNVFLRADVNRALAFVEAARAAAKEPAHRMAVERLAVAVYKNGIAQSMKRQAEAAGDDPMALNEVAWTCFEQKVNVREAIGWARKAAEKSDRDPMILDTLANLLWIGGARDEAIKTEEEAASKTAEDTYKREFESTVAKWRAEMAAMKAAKAVPMTPLVPPAAKPDAGGEDGEK